MLLKKQFINTLFFCLICISCNKEQSITSLEAPVSANSSLPRLYTDNTGKLFMSWVEQENDTSTLFYSKLEKKGWTDKNFISSSTQWFVNWADFPSLIALNGKPIAAHWLNKIPGNTYSYNVEIATYQNNTFNKEFTPHSDNTATEHGFVSMVPTSDSAFYSIWLDGRNTAGGHHDEYGGLSSAMTLRGALIRIDGNIIQEEELDNSVCDCCNTAITKTKNGLITAYRNRTDKEIRDIYIKRFVNGVWEDSKPVFNDNWEIAACPVNGPAIDSNGNTVAVAWFTGANEKSKTQLSFSKNLGETFNSPIVIDSLATLGRIDLQIADENSVWVSWISRDGNTGKLNLSKISFEGEVLEEHLVSNINPSRGSGFPQIAIAEGNLIIAWTELQEQTSVVRTSILEL